jgi:hypothetical protein
MNAPDGMLRASPPDTTCVLIRDGQEVFQALSEMTHNDQIDRPNKIEFWTQITRIVASQRTSSHLLRDNSLE